MITPEDSRSNRNIPELKALCFSPEKKQGADIGVAALRAAARKILENRNEHMTTDDKNMVAVFKELFLDRLKTSDVNRHPTERFLMDDLLLSIFQSAKTPITSDQVGLGIRADGMHVAHIDGTIEILPLRSELRDIIKPSKMQVAYSLDRSLSFSSQLFECVLKEIAQKGEDLLSADPHEPAWKKDAVIELGGGISLHPLQSVLERWTVGDWALSGSAAVVFRPEGVAIVIPETGEVRMLQYAPAILPFITEEASRIRNYQDSLHGTERRAGTEEWKRNIAFAAVAAAQSVISEADDDQLSKSEYIARLIQEKFGISVTARTLGCSKLEDAIGISSAEMTAIALTLNMGRDTITKLVRTVRRGAIDKDIKLESGQTIDMVLAQRQGAAIMGIVNSTSLPSFLGTDLTFDNIDLRGIIKNSQQHSFTKLALAARDLATRLPEPLSQRIISAFRAENPMVDERIRAREVFRDSMVADQRKAVVPAFVMATLEFQRAALENRQVKLPPKTLEAMEAVFGKFPGPNRNTLEGKASGFIEQ